MSKRMLDSCRIKFASILLLFSFALMSLFPPVPVNATLKNPTNGKTFYSQTLGTASYRSAEVLVRFRAGTSEARKDTVMAAHGGRLKKRLQGESGIERFQLPEASDAMNAALQLNLTSDVEFAEVNFLVKSDQLNVTPNDLRFAEEWALSNIGQNGGQYGSDINVGRAWQVTTGQPTTVIAVIDSGIDFTHPDLANNQWNNPIPTNGDLHGWDFITSTGTIKDEQGHGTAIAGIIAAQGNNSIGTSGVMWRAGLMSLRVLDNTGTGDVADAVEAIDYAVAHGAQVINLSWGTDGLSIALKDAIDRALRRGVSLVCSAGNGGRNIDDGSASSPYYPASFDLQGLIAVASTNNSDQLDPWSNFGVQHVAVAAPGSNILTTKMGGGYWNVSGTSAAAPFVTGVVGLMKTVRPNLNSRQVKTLITDSVRQTASLSGKVSSNGVVDAAKSIALMPGSAGNGNGNGGNNGSSPRIQPVPPGFGSGGTGPGGSFNRPAVPPTQTLPGSGNYRPDEIRGHTPVEPKPRVQIQANLACADCEPLSGGGGGENYPSGDPNFSTVRMLAVNETGNIGVDLGSRNFNWSVSLLSLPGRAGLDLDLTLFYNSLVWTKDGSNIKYNADFGSPAPGFRLGFPILQQRFTDAQTGGYAYIMVTSSGGRVEMRQIGSSNIYESQDGSYTQLDVNDPSVPVVRTRDGTQLTFTPVTVNNEFRCTQIKDRNGNFISATYDSNNGHLQTITDTLGRVITFLYDGNNNLQAIRQTWSGVAHDWAEFSYGTVTVNPNFDSGILVNGPSNNSVTVLTQVSVDDGSYYVFGYNAPFGQVNRITHYAPAPQPNNAELSHIEYNMDSSAGQTDCPRFTQEKVWATHWNNDQEAVTTYSVAGDGSWTQQTMPDGTIYKEFFATTGWQSGLTTSTEVWSGGVKKKWTTTAWTQDDTGLSYQKNPRPYDMSTYDEAGNRRHIDIIYTSYSLPGEVREYSADGSGYAGFIRRTYTDYNFSQLYIDRRIIGLLSAVHVVDENNNFISKTTFDYDRGGEYLVATPQAATQHDTTNYGAGFVTGRGNQTDVWRWDVTDINNSAKAIRQQHTGYNSTGSVVFTRDALDRQTSISYADAFSSGLTNLALNKPATQSSTINAGQLASADKAVDGNTDGNYWNYSVTHTDDDAQAWWQVDLGSMQSIQSIDIWNRTDCCGDRLSNFNVLLLDESQNVVGSTNIAGQAGTQTSILLNGTARYVKIQLVGANYLSLAEVQVWGDRKTFAFPTRVTDPANFSSTAQYSFDHSAVTLTTDPKGAGVSFEYDWARRPKRITNSVNGAYKRFVYGDTQDYTLMFETLNDSQEFYSFTWNDGAGRIHGAGGELPNSNGGYFVQKAVFDVMGRAVQTTNPTEITGAIVPTGDDSAFVWTGQTYDWKGRPRVTTNSDNTTTENVYGGCGCAGGEVTTVRDELGRRRKLTQDVLGRLKRVDELNWDQTVYATTSYTYNERDQITLIDQAGQTRSLDYDGHGRLQSRWTPEQGTTTYTYFTDDAVQTIMDARGATRTFAYNNRSLVTGITYAASGGAATTPNVSFDYDAAGNRTSMTDGLGSVSYAYNTLSQLSSETRTFTGLGSFTLSYGYNLSGELTSVTNPWNVQVAYSYDKNGRPISVTGANYADVSSYVNSISYRAFGVKQTAYGNGRQLAINYDNRLRMTRWDVAGVLGSDYEYRWEDTFRPTFAHSRTDATLDRWYAYDHVGRLTVSRSGSEARAAYGEPFNGQYDGPYSMGVQYDVWGNITYREGWGGWNRVESATYTSNRRDGMQFDAAGNLLNDGYTGFSYDVNGQPASASYPGISILTGYDGDGRRGKKIENAVSTYYLRSSVLGGQTVCEINGSGGWQRGYAYLGGQLLAVQQSSAVFWMHEDPVTKSKRVTDGTGNIVSTIELDPWGGDTIRNSNQAFQPRRFTTYERDLNNWDDAGARSYHGWWSRFAQPDPYDGSYDLTDPQSFNRYAFVQNDPTNFVDPSGLDPEPPTVGVVTVYGRFLDPLFTSGGRYGGVNIRPHYVVERDREPRPQRPTRQPHRQTRPGYVDQAILEGCLRTLFGLTDISFTPSAPGRNGTLTGTGILASTGQSGHVGVLNNVTATDTTDLRRVSDSVRRQNKQDPLPARFEVIGYTPGWAPHMNYSARNQSPQSLVETQVHELGHSLQQILKGPFVGNMALHLENCVRDNGGFTRK